MSNVSYMGYPGMEPEFTLANGRTIPAGELIAEHALAKYHEANPGLDESQLPAAWNALSDVERKGYCIQAFDDLDQAAEGAAAIDDHRKDQQVFVPKAERQLGNALLEIAVDAMRQLPRPWVPMTEDQQDDILERVTKQTREAVKETVRLLATRGTHHVVATLEQFTAKKGGAKAVLAVPAAMVNEYLIESVGVQVILVLAGELDAADDIEQPKADPQQHSLDIGNSAQHSDPED